MIGAGLAGLRAAWGIARAGHEVIVLERKTAAGGRAGSAPDPRTGEPVDTGQHVFMGCYTATREWFRALGTESAIAFQPRLEVPYLRAGGVRIGFRAAGAPAPLHLLGGLARLPGLTWRDRIAPLPAAMLRRPVAGLDAITVREWCDRSRVSRAVRELVVEPLALAAINDDPAVASALPLAQVIRTLAWSGNRGSVLGFARSGLGDAYAPAAIAAIIAAGGSVRTGTWAARMIVEAGAVKGVTLQDGTELPADVVVSCVPPSDLQALIREQPELRDLAEDAGRWQYSPILTVHLWLDRPVLPDRFAGLLGGSFDWAFNRTAIVGGTGEGEQQLALVKSGARGFLGRSPDELEALAVTELRRFLPGAGIAHVVRSRPVWETKATVSLAPGTDALRPGPETAVRGFVLAGDWTRTGLPATIESAVVSGQAAARHVISSLA